MKILFSLLLLLLVLLSPSLLFSQHIDESRLVQNSDSIFLDGEKIYWKYNTNTTVITAEQILERGYDNLDELLASVPGISLSHDRNFTQIGIRGISPTGQNNQRVAVFVDGVPLNSPVSGQGGFCL